MAKIKKHDILLVALNLAENIGYTKVTRDSIARAAKVAMGTVTNQLGTMKQIRRSIIRQAIRTQNLTVIAQALVNKDPLVSKLDPELRRNALESI